MISRVRLVRGFARVELCAVLTVMVVALALASIVGDAMRRNANLGQDIAKLREIAQATDQYGAANADRIWALSWKANVGYNTPWPQLNSAFSDMQAQANQAVFILRSHGNRPEMAAFSNVMPTVKYSHLPLAVFLNKPLPWLMFVSSGDTDRLRWAMDPAGHDQYLYLPCQAQVVSPLHYRYPYQSSFELTVSAWDRSPLGYRIYHAGQNGYYFVPSLHQLGGGLLTEIVHPSQKVLVFDEYARHFGEDVNYLYNHPEAKLPLMFGDGSVRLKKTRDSNPGWEPNWPATGQPTLIPSIIRTGTCIPGIGGAQSQQGPLSPGVFKWTRSGLAGRDFGGPEVWLDPEAAQRVQNGVAPARPGSASAVEP